MSCEKLLLFDNEPLYALLPFIRGDDKKVNSCCQFIDTQFFFITAGGRCRETSCFCDPLAKKIVNTEGKNSGFGKIEPNCCRTSRRIGVDQRSGNYISISQICCSNNIFP